MRPYQPFNYKTLLAAGFAFSLAACGDSSEKEPDGGGATENRAPVAANTEVEIDLSADFSLIDVLANASDPDGDTLSIASVGEAEFGTTSIEDNQISYVPEDGYFGIDTFTYTITDGELEDSAEVTVEVVATVSFEGRVVDSPIANATVTIVIDGVTHTVEADDEGFYELPATIRSLDVDEVIRIVATGSEANNQGHVTLSSMLVSVGRILERAGDDFTLSREEMNDVNVTHVTTARDVLMRRAAAEQAITDRNVAEYGNTIDPQLMIQMAGVIKLVIDNDDFDLPEGHSNIEDFLNDESSYNSFVEVASEGGDSSPLNQAIQETLEDPEIVPELRVEDLYGRFVQVDRAPAFLKPDTRTTWDINEDGLTWFGNPTEVSQRTTFSLNGNKLVPDETGVPLTQYNSFVRVMEFHFEGRPEAREAWLAYNGLNEFVPLTVERTFASGVNAVLVVSHSDSELVLRGTNFSHQYAVTFEYEGEVYEAIEFQGSEFERDVRLVAVEQFTQSDLTFDVAEQPSWLLPPPEMGRGSVLDAAIIDFAADNTYRMRHPEALSFLSSTEGQWELSEDARTLTLTTQNGEHAVRLTRHRNDADYQSVLREYLVDGEATSAQLRYGMPFVEPADFSPIETVTSSSQLFNSMVNYRSAVYWDDNDQLRTQEVMFDFHDDGRGEQLNGLCKGEGLYSQEVCDEPMTLELPAMEGTWQYKQLDDFETVFEFSRSQNEQTVMVRHWVPLEFSERNIYSVLEWVIQEWEDFDGSIIRNVSISPRFNHYQLAERPAETPAGLGLMSLEHNVPAVHNHGYLIVNPQTSSPIGELH